MDEKTHIELKKAVLELFSGITVYEAEMVIKSVTDELKHIARISYTKPSLLEMMCSVHNLK